jgi:hypothetical protein
MSLEENLRRGIRKFLGCRRGEGFKKDFISINKVSYLSCINKEKYIL